MARIRNARQELLDGHARRNGWEYVGLRSWRVWGFVIGVASLRREQVFIATRATERYVSTDLEALLRAISYVRVTGVPALETGPRALVRRLPPNTE